MSNVPPSPQTNPASADQRWLPVARLLRPQGRRGELLADPLTDLPEIFVAGREFRLEAHPAAAPLLLEACWRPTGRNAGRLVLHFAGVDSISAAEQLQDQQISVAETTLPAFDAGTFLVRDLLGCLVLDNNQPLGTVVDLQFPVGPDGHTRLQDAVDLLVLELTDAPPGAEPALIPFVKAWLEAVDLPGRRILMHLPPGLVQPVVEAENSQDPEDDKNVQPQES